MSEPSQAVHMKITGRVQGVGFRAFTRRTALDLGLVGWVRNVSDGSVELEVAGAVPALDQFRRAVADGPTFSQVENLRESPIDPATVDGTTFEIRF